MALVIQKLIEERNVGYILQGKSIKYKRYKKKHKDQSTIDFSFSFINL